MTERSDSAQPDRLEAYLDDQMAQPEREAFERTLQTDADLRAQVEYQGKIDQTLRRLFVPPPPSEELIASLRPAASEPSEAKIPTTAARGKLWQMARLVSLTAAACLVWGWVGWFYLGPSDSVSRGYAARPLAVIYLESVEQGFEPLWVCEDDRQFASTFLKRQGQGLLLRPLPKGTQMVGLAYLKAIRGTTTTLMARVDGEPVMVFVERLDRDRAPPAPSDLSGLHLYRKELAGLVLYELTPLDSPHVMDFFYPVDVPNPVEIPGPNPVKIPGTRS